MSFGCYVFSMSSHQVLSSRKHTHFSSNINTCCCPSMWGNQKLLTYDASSNSEALKPPHTSPASIALAVKLSAMYTISAVGKSYQQRI